MLKHMREFTGSIAEMRLNRLKLRQKDKALQQLRAQLQDQIKQREEQTKTLSQLVEGSPIPTFVIDSDCMITHWNRACEALTNLSASEMVGTDKHRQAFYPGRRWLMADLIVNHAGSDELARYYGDKYRQSPLIRDGYEVEDFFPKLGKNGKWLFFTAAPFKDAAGTILGAIETLQDITDRRIAEQQLHSSEARYRLLFESANDAIFLLKKGVVVDCNQKALELLSCARKDIIGLTPLDFSPELQPGGERSADDIEQKRQAVFQGVSRVFEWRFKKKDHSRFDAEVSITQLEIFDSPHSIAIVRNVTERKQLIETLKKREKELDEKTSYLEKVNQALKASLDHREVEKRAVEENMLVNLKRFVFPYLEELGKCKISKDAEAYLNIIDTNLNDIVSQFSQTVFSKYMNLTPTEIRIADFIRSGKNSKEIASQLGLSPSSVQWHRKNIREKLGLTNKKANLHTYLTSLAK